MVIKGKVLFRGELLRGSFFFFSVFFLCFFLLASTLYGQRRHEKQSNSSQVDSLPIIPQPGIPVDSIIAKIEQGQTTLNDITNSTRRGFSTWQIDDNLPEVQSYIATIRTNVSLYNKVHDMKNLLMFQVLLGDMQKQLKDWRERLSGYESQLSGMNGKLIQLAQDSVLVLPPDTNLRKLYFNSLKDLKTKWIIASESTNKNLTRINQLQAAVSDSYFETVDLTNVVNDRIREFNVRITGKEYDFIWAIPKSEGADEKLDNLVKQSYMGQREMLRYYFNRSSGSWFYMLVIGVAFFVWVSRSFRTINGSAEKQNLLKELQLRYLKPVPVFASLVVIFNFAPFFDLRPPAVYVELMQFLLLLALTVFFFRSWTRKLFLYWVVIFVLYILVVITRSSIIDPGVGFRLWMLLLNAISVLFGFLFLLHIRQALSLKGFIKEVSVIYIVLNTLAILFNIFGRLSLAKIVSTAAIFGLTQAIGLFSLVQIINEAFALQVAASKLSTGFTSRLNYAKIGEGLHRFLGFIAIIAWLIIFTNNLYIYSFFYNLIEQFLTLERKVGSTTFTWGNIILFFIVLYLSSLLRGYVGYFFGETSDEFGNSIGKKDSRLVMLRLLILIAGFLLAVVASGIALDKITVIVGALGVGIGLGLQNIVNNLVSGIILIFDKPFQIGDFIELTNKKGRVKDIGIRSSRLLTSEGSEVIIPNGDLLSGQVINWTVNDKAKRVELTLKADPDHELSLLESLIKDEIEKHTDSIKELTPNVYVSNIAADSIELKVQAWIGSMSREDTFRSEVLLNIYRRFKENGIKMM